MRYKNTPDLADDPPIPDTLRTKMVRITRGAKKIAIREQVGGSSFKQVNVLFLKVDGPRSQPEETLDEIVEGAAQCMHARWIERSADQESNDAIVFKLEAELVTAAAGRRRPTFTITWDPDASGDHRADDLDSLRDDVLLELMDHGRRMNDQMAAHVEELHATVIEQARMNTEPIQAASDMGKQATALLQHGFGLFQQALMTQYSQESARAEQEGKTKRAGDMWNRLDKYFAFGSKAVGDQLGAYVKRKMAGGNAATDEEHAKAKKASEQTKRDPIEVDDDNDDDTLENPIAVICEVFGSSLTPQQRKQMRESMAPELAAMFDELFCAETDDEAVELFQLIKEKGDPMELINLAGMLDPVQVEYYQRVSTEVEKAANPKED